MNENAGRIYSIYETNLPVPGCTISKAVSAQDGYDISQFSLAKGTDISAESYGTHKLWIGAGGRLEVLNKETQKTQLEKGQLYVTKTNEPIGIRAITDGVYTEITLREDSNMNEIIKAGDGRTLKDLLPYQEGRIVNMDLINDPKLKFVIMSFDAGTGLSEHAAPGEALIFALDGEAVIGYEGKEHRIHAGENFKFDKLGKHSVTADHRFKMALLLQLD